MRNLILLLLLFQINFVFCQWYQVLVAEEDHKCYVEVNFLNENIGYFVGSDIIGKTIDAGITWTIDTTIHGVFEKIEFANVDTGIICCYPDDGNIVIKTIDGGATWTYPSLTINPIPDDIQMLPSGVTYVADCIEGIGWQYVHKINDFYDEFVGATFVSDLCPAYDIEFVSNDTGYLVGILHFDTIVTRTARTFDGSNTWQPGEEGLDGPEYQIDFVTAKTGYGIGYEDQIWKSEDYAYSWDLLPWDFETGEFGLEYIYFYNEQVGYAVTEDYLGTFSQYHEVYRTIDGGVTWDTTYFERDTNASVKSIFCTGADTCYMSTCNGGIFKTTNGGGIPFYTVAINELNTISFSLSPNPSSSIIKINYQNSPDSYREGIKQITTTNYLGEKINILFDENDHADISHLPSGIYITEIITDKNKGIQKWVKL